MRCNDSTQPHPTTPGTESAAVGGATLIHAGANKTAIAGISGGETDSLRGLMRGMIEMTARRDFAYDNAYNRALQSRIYGSLDGTAYADLHDHDGIKLFSYSPPIPPRDGVEGDTRRLIIAGEDDQLVTAILSGLCSDPELNLHEMPFQVEKGYSITVSPGERGALKTGSPIDGSYTGPVQFNWGRSMHKVNESSHGKTSVVAASSDEDDRSQGGNMFTDHRIDYALMAFHGDINENNAAETGLSDADVALLEQALWTGLRMQTNTASKQGHEPRLLVRVEYATDDFCIGDLHHSLAFEPDGMDERTMRDITDGFVNATEFVELVERYAENIEHVHARVSRRLQVKLNGEDGGLAGLEEAITDALGSDSVSFKVD